MTETLILTDGIVRTEVLSSSPPAEAIGIREGKIAAVGSNREVCEALPNPDRRIELKGKTVLPSFTDSYASVFREMLAEAQINLSGRQSIPEIFSVVERYAKALPRDNWIIGHGWNKTLWGWKRFPHRADLDLVSPHHPVALFSSDQRVAWLNSAALEQIEIYHGTPDPPGGEIERDPVTKAATGIFKEKAVDMVLGRIPLPNPENFQKAIRKVAESYFRVGVTHVQTHDREQALSLYLDLQKETELPFNMLAHFPYSLGPDLCERGLKTGTRENRLTVGGLWIHVDGTLASQTAWLREPYADDWNHFGLEIAPLDRLKETVKWCVEHEFSPVVHASGDAACGNALRVLSETETNQSTGCSPLLVNGDLVDGTDLDLAAGLNLSLICSPHKIEVESRVGREYLGDRWNKVLNLRSWSETGTRIFFGSCDLLSDWNPLRSLQAAVCPSDKERGSRNAITLEEGISALCVRWNTVNGNVFSQPSLKPGEPANLVILSEDPHTVPASEISQIEILVTVLEGKIVFELVDNLGG